MKKRLKRLVAFISAIVMVVTSLVYVPSTTVKAFSVEVDNLKYEITSCSDKNSLIGFTNNGAANGAFNFAWNAAYATTVDASINGTTIKTGMGSGGAITVNEINSVVNAKPGTYTIDFVGTGGNNNPNNDTTATATLVVSEVEDEPIVDGTELIPSDKRNSNDLSVPKQESGNPWNTEYKIINLPIKEDAYYVAKYSVTSNITKKFELRLQDAANDAYIDYSGLGYTMTEVQAGTTENIVKVFQANRNTSQGIFDVCMGFVGNTVVGEATVQITNVSLKVYSTLAAAQAAAGIIPEESETESEEPELDWKTDNNLTAYFGEGTRYAVVSNYPGQGYAGDEFPGGDVTFQTDRINANVGAHGDSQTLTFNGEVLNTSTTSYACNNDAMYSKFKSGINEFKFVGHYTAGGSDLDVVASIFIDVPTQTLNFSVNDYSAYTGKYITKFENVTDISSYEVFVDGEATGITVGGSGDYFTVSELKDAGITTGNHTVTLKCVLPEGNYSIASKQSATINVPATAGNYSDIAQIYIQTDDTNLSPVEAAGKTTFDKNQNKKTASLTAVDKDGGTIPDVFEDGVKTTVKVRGNSTANAVKKAYNISFTDRTNLFGLDGSSKPAKKWSLLANAFDKALIRNYLGMQLGSQMGVPFTSSCKFVDLYFNGVFMGNYLVIESIEKGKSRVDIDSENAKEYKSDALVELEEIHAITAEETQFTTTKYNQTFIFGSPETVDDIGGNSEYFNQKVADVSALFNKFETDLFNQNWANIQQDIDVTSFAKFYVCNEIMTTKDFNQSSTRFHIVGGKIYGGPLWDMDYSSDNNADQPIYTREYQRRMPWFEQLMQIPEFRAVVVSEYKHIRPYVRNLYAEGGVIDQIVGEISTSAARNYASPQNNGAGWSINSRDNGDGYGYLSVAGATPYTSFNDENDDTSAVHQVKNYFEKRVEGLDKTWNVEACVELSHESGDTIASWDEVDGATGYKIKFSAKNIQPVSPAPLFVQQIADDYTEQTVTVGGNTLSYNFTDNNYELEDGSYVYVEYTLDGSTYDSLDYVVYHEMEEYEYITDWTQLNGLSENGAKIYVPTTMITNNLFGDAGLRGYYGAGKTNHWNITAGVGIDTVPVFGFCTTGQNPTSVIIDGNEYTGSDVTATDVVCSANTVYINQNLVDAEIGETNYYHITASGSSTGSFWVKVVGEELPDYSNVHVNDGGWSQVVVGDTNGDFKYYYETANLYNETTNPSGKINANILELRNLGSSVSYNGDASWNTLKDVPVFAFAHRAGNNPSSVWLNDQKLDSSECAAAGDTVILAQSLFDLKGEQSKVFYVTLRYSSEDYTIPIKVVDSTKEAPPALNDEGWVRYSPTSDYWFYIPEGSAITGTQGTTDRGGDLWMVLIGSIAHPYSGATFDGKALTVPSEGAGFPIPYDRFVYNDTVYKVVATDSSGHDVYFYAKKTAAPEYTPRGFAGSVDGTTLTVRWTPTADANVAGATYTVKLGETTIADSITTYSTTYDMSEMAQGQYTLTLITNVKGEQVDSQTINLSYTDYLVNSFKATGNTKLAWEKYRADKLDWNITSASPIVGYAYYVDDKLYETEATTETTHTYMLPAYAIAQIYSQNDPTNGIDAFGQAKSSGSHTVKVVAFTSNLDNAPATYTSDLDGKIVGIDSFKQDVSYIFGDQSLWNKTSASSPWNFTITDGSEMKINYRSDGSVKVSDMKVNKDVDEPQWQLKAAIYDRHLPVAEDGNKVNVKFDVRIGDEEFVGKQLYIKICSDEVDDNYSYYGENTPATSDVTYDQHYYTFESDGRGGSVIHYSITFEPHVDAPHGEQYDLLFGIGELEGADLELTVPEVTDVYKVTKAIASANLTDAQTLPGTITINWNSDVPEDLKEDYYYVTKIDGEIVSNDAQLSETHTGYEANSTHTVTVESWYKITGTMTNSVETTVTIPNVQQPNIVAASINIDNSSSRYVGDTIPIKVIVANVGDADCTDDFVVKLEAQPYGKETVAVGTAQTITVDLSKPADPTNPLADAVELTFNYPITDVGNTTFIATVDVNNSVTESTETDNVTMIRYMFYDKPATNEYCDVVGFQLNALTAEESDPSYYGPSFRTMARISYDDKDNHTIGGETVTEYGMVFALTDKAQSVDKDNMRIDSDDEYVAHLAANTKIDYSGWTTRGGKFTLDNSSFYGLTIKNLFYDEKELTKNYSFRAYYKLGEEVVYSNNIYTVNMEEIANDLYQNQKMYSKKSHEFLYNAILNPVAAKKNYLNIGTTILRMFRKKDSSITQNSPEYKYTNLVYKDIQGYGLCKQGYCYGNEDEEKVPDKDLRFTHLGPLNANNDGDDTNDMHLFESRRLVEHKEGDKTGVYLGMLNDLTNTNYSSIYDWIYNEIPENGFARRHAYSWEGHQYNSDDAIEDID